MNYAFHDLNPSVHFILCGLKDLKLCNSCAVCIHERLHVFTVCVGFFNVNFYCKVLGRYPMLELLKLLICIIVPLQCVKAVYSLLLERIKPGVACEAKTIKMFENNLTGGKLLAWQL